LKKCQFLQMIGEIEKTYKIVRFRHGRTEGVGGYLYLQLKENQPTGDNFLRNACFYAKNAQKITIFIGKMENFGHFW
jgi:hypothetical protein